MVNLLLVSAVIFAQSDDLTFCQNWNKGSLKDKTEFLLGPEPKLLDHLKKKGLSEGNINTFKVCFEKNIVKLRDKLDIDCRTEDTLTKFFGTQVDTSSQEYDHINNYVNMCTNPEGQET